MMKKFFKKLLAIIAAITLSVSVIPGTVAFGTETGAIPTLNDGQEALLRYMEVVPEWEEEIEYDRALTRGELAHMAARIANLYEYTSDDLYFYDVPVDYDYFHDIYTLFEMGVLAGDGDGFFRPDDLVSDAEICKVFSVLLGYREVGEFTSYLKTARAAGILDGVELDGVVTYGEAALMAYHTLHAPMLEATLYGDEKGYEVNENLTAIERYHQLVPQEGIVEGIYGTLLAKTSDEIEENTLVINDRHFFYEGGDDLLGYQVDFYSYRGSDGRPETEIQFIYADYEENQVITIEKEDIIKKDADYLYYWFNDNQEERVRIDVWTDAIFNGMAYPEYTIEELKSGVGTVTLVDNDGDDIVDVLLEESYSYMEVISYNSKDGILNATLFGKDSKTDVVIGSKDRDVAVSYLKGGKEARASLVRSGAFVAVKSSRNDTGVLKVIIDIIAPNITGKVETLAEDVLVVDGKNFAKTQALSTDSEIRLGDTVKVFVHKDKTALILHATEEDYLLGMLVYASEGLGGAFSSGPLQVKLVTTGRELKEYGNIKKVLIDGIKFEDNMDEAVARLEASAQMAGGYNPAYPQSQFIRYRIDASGQLTHIDTMDKESGEAEDSLQLSVTKTTAYATPDAMTFFQASETGATLFSMESLAATFRVPNDARDDINWYATGNANSTEAWTVEAYNVDPDTGVAKYWINYIGRWTTVSTSQVPLVVARVESALGEDGYPVYRVVGKGESGSEKTLVIEDGIYFSKSGTDPLSAAEAIAQLNVGDVIDYRMDQKNKTCARIVKLFSPGDKKIEGGNTDRVYYKNNSSSKHETSYSTWSVLGTVLNVGAANFIRHTASIPGDEGVNFTDETTLQKFYPYYVNAAAFYIYDSSNPSKGIQVGKINDIETYKNNPQDPDLVYIASRSGAVKYVYIMK